MSNAVAATLLVLSSGFAASATSAQVIRGRVLVQGTRTGIPDVSVTLLADSANVQLERVVTDSTGRFRMVLDSAGTYSLRTEHIGYATSVARALEIGNTEEIEVELRMGPEAIPLEPLVVIARRPERFGRLSEFYNRKEWMEKLGVGSFVTREQIERRTALESSDLLRMVPGVRLDNRTRAVLMTRQAGGCSPAVFVDGMHMNRGSRALVNDYVVPDMIEGIEIYRGSAESPAQYQDHGGCGAILIWTRQGTSSGKPFSWWRAAVGGGIMLGILLLVR